MRKASLNLGWTVSGTLIEISIVFLLVVHAAGSQSDPGTWQSHQRRTFRCDLPPAWRPVSPGELGGMAGRMVAQRERYSRESGSRAEDFNTDFVDLAAFRSPNGNGDIAVIVLRIPAQKPDYLEGIFARSKEVMSYFQGIGRIKRVYRIEKPAGLKQPAVLSDAETISSREITYTFFTPVRADWAAQLIMTSTITDFQEHAPLFERVARSFEILAAAK